MHSSVLVAVAGLAACGSSPAISPSTSSSIPDTAAGAPPRIHQVASPAEGILANAYLIEGPEGVVVVDATLRVSDARALRARVDALGRPLRGVLLTHGHPDHYNGVAILTEGLDVPVVATREVDAAIRAADAAKETQWKPLFGAEWPTRRVFPNRIVGDGEAVRLAGLSFQPHTLGPAESHADSYWTIQGAPGIAFVGDLVFPGMHAYISDGHTAAWIAVLDRLGRELPAGVTLYPGHGAPGGVDLLGAQRRYLERLRTEIRALSPTGAPLDDAARARLVAAMKQHQPSAALEMLLALGADAVAAELAAER